MGVVGVVGHHEGRAQVEQVTGEMTHREPVVGVAGVGVRPFVTTFEFVKLSVNTLRKRRKGIGQGKKAPVGRDQSILRRMRLQHVVVAAPIFAPPWKDCRNTCRGLSRETRCDA